MESDSKKRLAAANVDTYRIYIHYKGGIRLDRSSCPIPIDPESVDPSLQAAAIAAFRDWAEGTMPRTATVGFLFLSGGLGQWLDIWPYGPEGEAPAKEPLQQAIRKALLNVPLSASNPNPDMPPSEDATAINVYTVPILSDLGEFILLIGGSDPPSDQSGISPSQVVRRYVRCFLPYLYYRIEQNQNRLLADRLQRAQLELHALQQHMVISHSLFSSNDADGILAEVIRQIRGVYPEAEVELFTTQDHEPAGLPVKPLRLLDLEEHICTRAYMEGQVILENRAADGEYEMAVPISGKQGIYAVLRILTRTIPFEQTDAKFVQMVSATAGIAFENAKLYEQSNIRINELRLINELNNRLSQSLQLDEVYQFACDELIRIFRAEFCCILQLNEQNQFEVKATNWPNLANQIFTADYGFSGLVYRSREPVIISDYLANPAVPSKLMQATGSRSLIAAPILVHSEVAGAILVSHRKPGYFSYDNYKLLQVLSGNIGLAASNASLHAKVSRMAITDHLTGLYARHYLDEQVAAMQLKDNCGSLILVDIDDFKQINDSFGHQVGDGVLQQVSNIIRTSIRDSDIAARWGGEELAVYLPQTPAGLAASVAERIRMRIEQECDPAVTVSCGVSEWSCEDEKNSVEQLVYRADVALYQAKREGKNRIKQG